VTVLLWVGLVLLHKYVVNAENSFLPTPPEVCGEPQPNGLTNVVKQLSDSFPTYEFLGVFMEAVSEDEQVIRTMEILMSKAFYNLTYKIQDIDEWMEISDMLCDDLQFNINFYFETINDLLKIVPMEMTFPRPTTRKRPGVVGLIEDVIAILPLEDYERKFNELAESNEDVQTVIGLFKGDLFRVVVDTVLQLDEFKQIKQSIDVLDVPTNCGIALFKKMLGFPYDKCACKYVAQLNLGQC